MIIKVQNETPFQVLTGAFTIGPSSTGYELQVGATPDNFATLFSVGANTTRMVTNVANGSYYRLKNNVGEVQVNWSRTCVEQGGSGGSGTTYTAGDYIDLTGDVISVTGITPDAYLTSADTEDFATKLYVSSAVTPVAEHLAEVEQVASSGYNELHTQVLELSAITEEKADKKILVDFDHTSQAERASVYADLYALYSGGSGSSINKLYDFYKTVNTWQGLKIDYYGFSGDTVVFGKVVSPENTADQVVYEQVLTIDSAGTVNVVTNSVGGGPDLSAYYTSAQTEDAISAATSGKADAANVTANTDAQIFPGWNEQGIITGASYDQSYYGARLDINGNIAVTLNAFNEDVGYIWAPTAAGTAGDILVSTGDGAPVWSAVTMPDMSEYTPTSGFATVNGSAITNGGNIVIEGGSGPAPDMSAYMTSGDAQVISTALVDLDDRVDTIENRPHIQSVDMTGDMLPITTIVKLFQSQYDELMNNGELSSDILYVVLPDGE